MSKIGPILKFAAARRQARQHRNFSRTVSHGPVRGGYLIRLALFGAASFLILFTIGGIL